MKIENFYTAFGYLTCAFAEMEADLRCLIAGLAFGENSITASTFLDSSQLAENTATLRKLARQHAEYEVAMADIAKRIERLRQTRNLFIHGLWDADGFTETGGVATVRDLNTVYEKKGTSREWTKGRGAKYSLSDFNSLLTEISAITSLIENLCVTLEDDNELDFSPFGSTIRGRPTRFSIRPDGSLGET